MDDCYALKINKKQPLLLTWNGNEECYRKHSKSLLSLIGDGAISWKREDKRFPYPLHVRFTPKWTKFAESMVLQPSDEVPACSEIGFVHVFFVYASSVESYRQSVRHEVSDWFSTVNKDDTQWMIVFDSSRAKEKKNRGHLLEKIKSDFARFLHRVHEITDSGERSTVHTAFLPNFAAALDSYAACATSAILKSKDAADSDVFSPVNLVNQWLNLSYFYWSLDLLEHVLSELDEMEAFTSQAISEHASKETVPAWVKQMREFSLGKRCATLEAAMALEKIDATSSLLELRCYVLSQQLLTSMHVFNHRLKEATRGTAVADDLRHSFLSFLLRYTYEALSHVIEDCIAFKASSFLKSCYRKSFQFGKYDMLLQAQIVVWYWEAMNLGRYLADVLNTREAAYFTCLISVLYSQTLSKMCNSLPLDASTRSTLVKWLTVDDTLVVSGFCKELLSMICADHSGLLHRHSAREIRSSIGVLERFGWTRSIDELRVHLAKLLSESGEQTEAFAVTKEVLSRAFTRTNDAKSLYAIVNYTMTQFGQKLQGEHNLHNDCLLFSSLLQGEVRDPDRINESDVPLMVQRPSRRFNFAWEWPLDFPFKLTSLSDSFCKGVLNTRMQLSVSVRSAFPRSIKCVVSLVYKRLKRTTVLAVNPSFVCSANSENVPCLSRVSKGVQLRSAEIVDNLRVAVEGCNDDCLVFSNNTSDDGSMLEPGNNVLGVSAKPELLGCYYLHHVKVETPLSEFYLHYATEMLHQRGLEMAFSQIGVTKPRVTLNDDATLYAGVPQRLRLKLVSGTIATSGGSILRIRQSGDSAIELLCPDEEWRSHAEYPIPALKANEAFHLVLVACLSIDRLNYSADQSLLLHHALQVEWLDEEWTIALKSTSIMSIKTVLHHITDKVLFEADIQRCDDQRDLVVRPLEARTYQQQDIALEPVEAILLNPTLEEVLANSSYRLVWQLPENQISKTVPVSHRFLLKYRVDLTGKYAEAFPSLAVRQKVHSFEDELVFAVDKVEYEICAQILSERPQTVLCRAESQCDLIVSLRSLLNQVEAIVVALDVDPTHWAVLERYKVIQIKESGLGQATFGIVPKKVGFLPYPHIKIHRCNFDANAIDQVPEATLFGERLTSYNRNEGKQVHVLGPVVHSEDSLSGNSSTASGKKSLRTQAKQRLQKLFEPKQSDRLSTQL